MVLIEDISLTIDGNYRSWIKAREIESDKRSAQIRWKGKIEGKTSRQETIGGHRRVFDCRRGLKAYTSRPLALSWPYTGCLIL